MGWLKLKRMEAHPSSAENKCSPLATSKSTFSVEHIEVVIEHPTDSARPWVHPSTPDAALPFIGKNEIHKVKSDNSAIWIVIDSIVYDCTEFINEHPGGAAVIRSFAGEDCSWQFWRIHSRQHLEEIGTKLRVGRTEGVRNRFREIPRYIGLRKLGNCDEW